MPREKAELTKPMLCRHCANTLPLEVAAIRPQLKIDSDEDGKYEWEAGWIYRMLACPTCLGVSLHRYYYHPMAGHDEPLEEALLFPDSHQVPPGLPLQVERAFFAAMKVRSVDANAFAVLLRRVLELVCVDRSADGETLNQKLEDLCRKGALPEKLVGVARGLRQLGNVGAHAVLGEVTTNETPILEDLSRAVLNYVYSAPFLAAKAEESLKRLKDKSKDE